MPTIRERFKKSWNIFFGRDPTNEDKFEYVPAKFDVGYGTSYRPDRLRYNRGNAKSIVPTIYNRIAMDVAAIELRHVKVDENDRYQSDIDSHLNACLTYSANTDQTGRAFIQDVVHSMFDEGVVAIVPTDCDTDITRTKIYEAGIYALRVGKFLQWFPQHVKVSLYNETTGRHQEVMVPKSICAIVENPLYTIMNEPNSTMQRLIRTINNMDILNDQNSSGKLDMIIQLPYVIKSELKRQEAEKRRKDIEDQLTNSKYGIAYADGTERIVQLNRSLENNLWQQVTDLTTQLYNQLGLTQTIFDGTANEETMLNYYNRTVEPICAALADEMERKFLSLTAYTQRQRIKFFRSPFKLVPAAQLADIADKFTRNEIMSSNEFRAEIGYKPVDSERANELINKNMPLPDVAPTDGMPVDEGMGETGELSEDPVADAVAAVGNTPDPLTEGAGEADAVDPNFDPMDLEASTTELEKKLKSMWRR